jgi:hypothetical protein
MGDPVSTGISSPVCPLVRTIRNFPSGVTPPRVPSGFIRHRFEQTATTNPVARLVSRLVGNNDNSTTVGRESLRGKVLNSYRLQFCHFSSSGGQQVARWVSRGGRERPSGLATKIGHSLRQDVPQRLPSVFRRKIVPSVPSFRICLIVSSLNLPKQSLGITLRTCGPSGGPMLRCVCRG